jgi:NhaA family Na+:H+ antiporter
MLPAQKFIHTETNSGMVLLAGAVLALVWANSPWGAWYELVWQTKASVALGHFTVAHSLREWINDALMAVFFLVVGLEVKREFVHGELSGWRRASLPVICALGGMLAPALLYIALNHGSAGAKGWGIPMATDIAFALGVLAVAGSHLPPSLRVLLLALATVDDIGAILVIAFFYTDQISVLALAGALLLLAMIIGMQRLGVQNLLYFTPVALLFWFAVYESGIHATIAGVALGLVAPTTPYLRKQQFVASAEPLMTSMKSALVRKADDKAEAVLGELGELTTATESIADRLVRLLHPWSSYLILPIFAFANTGVRLNAEMIRHAFGSPITRGIVLALVVGKFAGILGFAWIAVRLRISTLMAGMHWQQLAPIGILGGIGFTVSLFISDLAFTDQTFTDQAKIGILMASVVSGASGFLIFRLGARTQKPAQ